MSCYHFLLPFLGCQLNDRLYVCVAVITGLGGLRLDALRRTKKVFNSHRIDVVRGKVKWVIATFSTPGERKKLWSLTICGFCNKWNPDFPQQKGQSDQLADTSPTPHAQEKSVVCELTTDGICVLPGFPLHMQGWSCDWKVCCLWRLLTCRGRCWRLLQVF